MKYSKIEILYTTLAELSNKEMPIKISYRIAKILDALGGEYDFYRKKIQNILQKYGEKDDEGQLIIKDNQVPFIKEYADAATKELEELQNIDINLPDVKINISELEDIKLTPLQVNALKPFIEE